MKIVKSRCKPVSLEILSVLGKRMSLQDEEKNYLLHLEKGFEGETQFDTFVEQLTCEGLVLNDLLLTINGTTCQIDALILTADTVYLYEIKNYQGNFQYKSNQLYTFSGKEVVNPLIQLNRTATLMRQLLKQLGSNLKLEAAVLFLNPSFTLYNVPVDKPFIFSTQLQTHFAKLDRNPLPLSKKHQFLADKLVLLHQNDSPFARQLPDYTYAQLRKGLTCPNCGSFDLALTQRTCHCKDCGHTSPLNEALLKQIEELILLFPDLHLTKNLLYDWFDGKVPKKKIWKLLQTHFKRYGSGRGCYYQ
ncbi:nuclease-related domain-containing protein [Pisciglobus halotolerans]|uniref:Nuclease-related domain-containing protein n=1 Tax=Pisciglobus halotolerans TaxID=745365 RepID=A0A1I3CR45_9LACT|nr:nuclease-related domain-containing protein [Pisciglobus halotolerans]SFH76741.1 Nuclease-related domain-containing protein [Pisciglobus halotolerans]